ncbi:MAG: Mechanosensitive ion channel family protein [uncultured Aureispira sp.]|uniref:Mechanosensitive ion channel family protein n=1 Tax=uncultured Aureispira sp. TaxID=1331704 RepID=A0A6S6U222_9BACT|nr:MAG: Mechanosensitive ion channel family protein [uncultured Aureispira sp.]
MKTLEGLFEALMNYELFRRLFIWVLVLVVLLTLLSYIKKKVLRNAVHSDNKYKIVKAVNVLKYILIVSAFLFVFSDKLGNVGITLGLASAGIAFALQAVIISIAGWLSIMTTGQIKVGQRVKIGDITGDIIDIGVIKTTLMEVGAWVNGDLYNGRITEISNSFVFNAPIQNYSGHYPFLWDEIRIPLRTESDFHLARKIFVEVTNEVCGLYAEASKKTWEKMQGKFLIENASVEPSVTLMFDENWITFTIRFVVDYKKRRSTKDLLFTRILDEINKQDTIGIATAAMEIKNTT